MTNDELNALEMERAKKAEAARVLLGHINDSRMSGDEGESRDYIASLT